MASSNLTTLLKSKNLTRAGLARDLGIAPQAVYQWETIPLDKLPAVSKITGIPIEKLHPAYAKAMKGAA